MFPVEIIQEPSCRSLSAVCQTAAHAKSLRDAFIGPVRQISLFADLYCEGTLLFLEAPDSKTLLKIANILNHSIEQF